jgi:hypothetical protein
MEARAIRDRQAIESRRILASKENQRTEMDDLLADAKRDSVRQTLARGDRVRDRLAKDDILSKEIRASQAPDAKGRRANVGNAAAWGATAASGAAAGGAFYALDRMDKYERVQTLMKDPEFVKTVQRSLKAAGEYKGRADGRLDADVKQAIGRFNNVHGVKAKPNELTPEGLKKLEEYLASRGKEKQAEALREQQQTRR